VTVQKYFRIIKDITAECYIYVWVSRSFVTAFVFGFTMARVQLVLLALLATSISVRAKSVINPSKGEDQIDCESFL
jgi:hypothetical protein